VEVCRIDPLTGSEWDRLAASHGSAGIFHGSAWARVLHRTYSHTPCYLALRRGGKTEALVPLMEVRSVLTGRRGVSVPFADFGGPLLFDGADPAEVTTAVSNLARERHWRHFEMRGGEPPAASAHPSVSFYTHILDLKSGPEALLANVESSVRRALRKAERSGITTEIRTDKESVLAYYRLHVRTRRKHGLPPQPLAFFLNIWEEVVQSGQGFVVIASRENTPLAAAVFFHCGTRAVYKFGASDERVLEVRANNLVMWAAIEFLASRGFASLHFGRTSLSQEGLRRYKLGWGTSESSLNYFRFDLRTSDWIPGCDRAAGAHNAFFSRIPLALNRLAGRMIYPHLD
jgi:hypothetical protein